jgi:hypothetical protein
VLPPLHVFSTSCTLKPLKRHFVEGRRRRHLETPPCLPRGESLRDVSNLGLALGRDQEPVVIVVIAGSVMLTDTDQILSPSIRLLDQ